MYCGHKFTSIVVPYTDTACFYKKPYPYTQYTTTLVPTVEGLYYFKYTGVAKMVH